MSAPPLPLQVGSQMRPATAPRARHIVVVALVLLLGPLLLLVLRGFPTLDQTFQTAIGHFWIVSVAALIAVGLALLMLRAAVVRRDGRVLLIGASFLALSTIFLVHAISTPSVMFDDTVHATMWSTPLALLVGAVFLASSTVERFAEQSWLIRQWRLLVFGGGIVWLGYSVIMLGYIPAQLATSTHHGSTVQLPLQMQLLALAPRAFPLITATSVTLYLGAAIIYAQRWRRTPTRPLAALACGAVLLAETALAAQFGVLWHWSFWLYHLLLLASVVTVFYSVVVGYEQAGSFSTAVEGLLLGETLNRQRRAFGQGMSTLLVALERGQETDRTLLRGDLRRRFGLADDQIDLLEHAVQVVAQEREEQQRLRALAAVSRAATHDLDPDLLLQNALLAFAQTTNATLCAVGLLDNDRLVFAPQHRVLHGRLEHAPVNLSLSALPPTLSDSNGEPIQVIADGPLAKLGLPDATLLLIPLRHHGTLLGVFVAQPRLASPIDERLVAVCQAVGAQLATALVNARLYQELQHKHRRLVQSEQMREQLTQMIVHDLKNPLTVMRGATEMLGLTEINTMQRELATQAHRSTTMMLQLVNDMLDVARLEEGRLELHVTPTDLVVLLQECSQALAFWAKEQHNTVAIAVPSSLPQVHLDANLLRRVLINLLGNALKHTPQGTRITLGASVDGGDIWLWVHDTGPGIPPAQLARLFERFGATAASTERQSNTGLGLTFCRLAVVAHGGSITVHSVVGEGTTFTIQLPVLVAYSNEHKA